MLRHPPGRFSTRFARTGLVFFAAALASTLPTLGKLPTWELPIAVKKLDNGLTVVVSEDPSTPTFGVSMVYGIGFRREPRGRTGFAHLFEHMMFQGTPKAPKGLGSRVIEGGGGWDNGSTRFDYTNYIASAPVSALEPILWLEADRMRALDFSPENLANQQEVVKEEVRLNIQNRPYGGFYWLDLGQLIFDRWENSHDGYGSFDDLEAATIDDVKAFHRTYYAPNNAVLGIAGDVDAERVFALVEKYFGALPAQEPPLPLDVSEPPNRGERSLVQGDVFAQAPAVAVGFKMPSPDSPDFLAGAVLSELLVGGEASRLYQRLVKRQALVLDLSGGVNFPLGNFLTTSGPTIFTLLAQYKPHTEARAVVSAIHDEISEIAAHGVSTSELERTKVKMLSDLYSDHESLVLRANTLALQQLLTGDAASVNRLAERLDAIHSADLKRFAGTYLTVANSAFIDRRPQDDTPTDAAAGR